jgi:hypothetical protein
MTQGDAVIKSTTLAAFAILTTVTTASALPVSQAAVDSGPSIIKVQHRQQSHRAPAPPRYVAGRSYRTAPRGWHNHRARPDDWQTRGCVKVGVAWFCP